MVTKDNLALQTVAETSSSSFIFQNLPVYFSFKMGGGRRYPYPKWVWSPAGGWWPNPTNWKRNAALYVGVTFTLAYFVAQYADANTVSPCY